MRSPEPEACSRRTGPAEELALNKVAKSSTAAGGLLADLADWLADWRTWRTQGLCLAAGCSSGVQFSQSVSQ
eukprot:gene10758-biopygen4069